MDCKKITKKYEFNMHYVQVRSLCMLLSLYPGNKVYFVAPPVVKMRDDIKVRGSSNARKVLGLGDLARYNSLHVMSI